MCTIQIEPRPNRPFPKPKYGSDADSDSSFSLSLSLCFLVTYRNFHDWFPSFAFTLFLYLHFHYHLLRFPSLQTPLHLLLLIGVFQSLPSWTATGGNLFPVLGMLLSCLSTAVVIASLESPGIPMRIWISSPRIAGVSPLLPLMTPLMVNNLLWLTDFCWLM